MSSEQDAPPRGPQEPAPEAHGEGAFGETLRRPSVTEEAIWGVTAGAPSGGISGGTPAREVERRTEGEAAENEATGQQTGASLPG